MTKQQALAMLQGAHSLISQVIDSMDEIEECDHPADMIEPLPTTMGMTARPVKCRACGTTLEIPWEGTTDGET